MDVFQAIFSRVPVEEYTEEPIEFNKIIQVVESGCQASCAGNLQVWRFIVVTKKEKIRALIPHCLKQDCLYTAQFTIVVCVEEDPYESFYGLRGKRLYATQDCGAAVQNMLLASYALGIGAHWVRAFDEERVKDLFGIPANVRPQAIITLGYPLKLPEKKPTKDLQTCFFFNSYGGRIEYGHRVLRDYSIDVQQYKALVKEQFKPTVFGLADHAKRLFLKGQTQIKERAGNLKERASKLKEKWKAKRR